MIDALADGDVSQVLVALSALLAGGWGPQQLGTELIDDLRQVFLAALAPELCTVSGPSLERFRSVAEAMGLARVVRSMEILGHALVDMREAPDAQVVLEIAAVRAVRPDLDSGMEALSERVSVLERSQSGAPAFPDPAPRRHVPRPRRPAAPASEPTPGSPGGAAPAGGGGATPVPRCGAAQQGGGSPPRRPPRRRPPRRRAPRGHPPRAPSASGAPATGGSHRRQPARSIATASPRPGATAFCSRLPARAKARYASGRFVAVDDQGAHFALPNAAHREQCAEQQPVVEAALSDHFGTKVTLVLDIDDTGTPPAAGPGPSPAASGRPGGGGATAQPPPVDEDEYVDPSELIDDTVSDQASAAEARLLQAFPGASEVAE